MKLNIVGLPFLEPSILNEVFTATFGDDEAVNAIKDIAVRDFATMLIGVGWYNVKYRSVQLKKLLPTLQESLGDLDADPEGAAVALGVVLAIKELYGMRPDTLKSVMRQVTVQL